MQSQFKNTLKIQEKIFYMLDRNMLHQSLLLWGNNGVGKSTMVRNIVKKILNINCLVSPDLLIVSDKNTLDGVQKKSHVISIEDVRMAIEFGNTSSIGQNKFLVFDGIDNMSIGAINSILKLVEEPVKNLYIILIARNLHTIPKTLRSRCINFHVEKPSYEDFSDFLSEKFSAKQLTTEFIEYLYKVCEGNLNATSVFLSFASNDLLEKISQPSIGLEDLSETLTSCKDECVYVIFRIILFEISQRIQYKESPQKEKLLAQFESINDLYNKIDKSNLNKSNVIFAITNALSQ